MLVENMSHKSVMEIYRQADIIIDQLCIEAFGMLSLERMALGKPVICYIPEDLIETYASELPIINANPKTIYNQLRSIISNGELLRNLGEKGRVYVERHHDSIKIAHQLKSLYEIL
ncbi:glycosyltransferase [Priestia megaterium]|nr:glycosyltransferase [Priestia megaterium]